MNEWHVPAMGSVICLYIISALSGIALLYSRFRDNWLQTLGLAGMVLWSLGRASVLDDRETVSFYQFAGHCSLVLYGLGTAWKVWKNGKVVS